MKINFKKIICLTLIGYCKKFIKTFLVNLFVINKIFLQIFNNLKMLSSLMFMIFHMTIVMLMAIFGNLFLIFVILRGTSVVKQKISPVQVKILLS